MPTAKIHACQCANCLQSDPHPDKLLHQQMNLFLSRLDEQQRRWYVALESKKIGRSGDTLLSTLTGMDLETIRRGRRELDASLEGRPTDRIRVKGGGRKAVEKKRRPH